MISGPAIILAATLLGLVGSYLGFCLGCAQAIKYARSWTPKQEAKPRLVRFAEQLGLRWKTVGDYRPRHATRPKAVAYYQDVTGKRIIDTATKAMMHNPIGVDGICKAIETAAEKSRYGISPMVKAAKAWGLHEKLKQDLLNKYATGAAAAPVVFTTDKDNNDSLLAAMKASQERRRDERCIDCVQCGKRHEPGVLCGNGPNGPNCKRCGKPNPNPLADPCLACQAKATKPESVSWNPRQAFHRLWKACVRTDRYNKQRWVSVEAQCIAAGVFKDRMVDESCPRCRSDSVRPSNAPISLGQMVCLNCDRVFPPNHEGVDMPQGVFTSKPSSQPVDVSYGGEHVGTAAAMPVPTLDPEQRELIASAAGTLGYYGEFDCDCDWNPDETPTDEHNSCKVCQLRQAARDLEQLLAPKPRSLHPSRLRNPPERIYFERWCRENERQPGINGGLSLMDHLTIPEDPDGKIGDRPVGFSERDMMIATTVIQWLGTSCGQGFLIEAEREIKEVREGRDIFGFAGAGGAYSLNKETDWSVERAAEELATQWISIQKHPQAVKGLSRGIVDLAMWFQVRGAAWKQLEDLIQDRKLGTDVAIQHNDEDGFWLVAVPKGTIKGNADGTLMEGQRWKARDLSDAVSSAVRWWKKENPNHCPACHSAATEFHKGTEGNGKRNWRECLGCNHKFGIGTHDSDLFPHRPEQDMIELLRATFGRDIKTEDYQRNDWKTRAASIVLSSPHYLNQRYRVFANNQVDQIDENGDSVPDQSGAAIVRLAIAQQFGKQPF